MVETGGSSQLRITLELDIINQTCSWCFQYRHLNNKSLRRHFSGSSPVVGSGSFIERGEVGGGRSEPDVKNIR